MRNSKYKLEEIKIGNQIRFKRIGIDDFDMYWTVIGFNNKMIQVKINEMEFKDELYIDLDNIESLLDVNDTRYVKE